MDKDNINLLEKPNYTQPHEAEKVQLLFFYD